MLVEIEWFFPFSITGLVRESDIINETTDYITESATAKPYRKEVCFDVGTTVDFLQRTGLLTLSDDHINCDTHTFKVRPPDDAIRILIMKLQLQAISK